MMEALSPGRETEQCDPPKTAEINQEKLAEQELLPSSTPGEEMLQTEPLVDSPSELKIIKVEPQEQEITLSEDTAKPKTTDSVRRNATLASKKKKRVKSKNSRRKSGVICEVCHRQFRDSHNLKRHFDTKHGECYTCDLCSAVYNTERKLQRHLKKHANPRESSTNTVRCTECSRVFRDKHNMKIHKCSKTYKKSSCIYPECELQFYHVTKMLKHVEEDHDSKIDAVYFTFESEDLFQRWKEEEELASFAYFSKRSGTVDSDFGSYRYYVCQANGDSINCPRKTTKRWKKGQVRMGKLCPSRMLVKEVNGKISVKYIALHSHDRSIKNDKLPVPKSVKTYAKNLLLMGASPQQVRKSVCEGLYGGSSIIPQGGYVISNRYFFDLKKRLENKSFSPTDEEKDKYDPVFVFKPQGQNVVVGDEELDKLSFSNDLFAIGLQTKEQCLMMKKRAHKIVCVISAQTYSIYGFEILTVVVPDVFGNGYPVAHFLTSHVDEVTLKLLFLSLRMKCPNVKIRSVMTDDDDNVFNAICSTFGSARHYLCHWYVKKSWEDEINKSCKNKIELCRSLKALLIERNRSVFKSLCNEFVEENVHQNPDFVKYFASNFLTRPEVWAMCHRHSTHQVSNPQPYTNISLHCEYFHNKLKEFIATESLSQRGADVALLLLNIQEGHCHRYREQQLKGTRVRSAASGKHHNGMLIDNVNVSYVSGSWTVKSQFDESAEYIVVKKASICGKHTCPEKCHEASCKNLCNHLYRCSCDDRDDLCEHIHKVHSWRLKQEQSPCITASKMKPRNIEFILSELSENIENNVNYITVIKKEKDNFTDTDVDFVHISISEVNERVEVVEGMLPEDKERSMKGVNRVVKQRSKKGTLAAKPKHTNYEKSSVDCVNTDTHLKENVSQRQSSGLVQNTLITSNNSVLVGHQPPIKIERVDDGEDNEPIIKIERLHDDCKGKELQLNMEAILKSEDYEPLEQIRRTKRQHNGSVVQAAIENKKRRLDPILKEFEIKSEDTTDVAFVSARNKSGLKCKNCSRVFRDKYNLNRHVHNKHSAHFSYACKLCPAVFKTKLRFDRHVKKHEGTKSMKSVQCAECLRLFRDHYNMRQHQCAKANKRSACIYPDCGMQFYHMTQMVKHLEQDHDDKIECNNLYFESEKLFQAWKEEEEALSLAVFNKRNGTIGSDHVKYSYYICQAGGETIGASKTQRRWRNKIRTGKACPSRMLVKEKNGKVTVKYISYHSHDVKDDYKTYPPLPKYVKELGKQLLLMGVPPKRVRESIQDGVLLTDNQITPRKYAVKGRYFYDMKKRLEKKGCVFPNDTEETNNEITDQNVIEKPMDFAELLIASGKHKNYDPVLVYKPKGRTVVRGDEELDTLPASDELFAFGLQTKDQCEMMKEGSCKIVCIKSYFNVNVDGFQLLNIAVPDKYGNGYPIAHFLTNRVDEVTLIILFRILKNRCPNLKIQALITDDDLCIYKAMQAVFGEIYHYMCLWHIKTCWLEKIDQLVESQDHKVDIPFRLMDILYEKDEGKFQSLCRSFVDIYSKLCTSFTEYFVDFFLARPEVWAMCYRQSLYGISYPEPFSNVNLHCEYLHNRLKTLSVSGKFPQRGIELVELLYKIDRDYNLLYKRNIHLSVPVSCSASGRHYSGLEIDDKNVSNLGDTWTVLSRFDKSIKYTVNVIETTCNRVNCYEKCTEFLCLGLCNHMYVCSCEDRADLCEHIHKVHSLQLRRGKPSDVELFTGDDRASSIQVIVHESLDKVPPFESRLNVEMESFSNLDPGDDKVVYHEIYELNM